MQVSTTGISSVKKLIIYYYRGVEQRAVRRRRSNTEAAEGDAGVISDKQ